MQMSVPGKSSIEEHDTALGLARFGVDGSTMRVRRGTDTGTSSKYRAQTSYSLSGLSGMTIDVVEAVLALGRRHVGVGSSAHAASRFPLFAGG